MIDVSQPLEPQIRREIVEMCLVKSGYALAGERVERIADRMREFMDLGCSALSAYAESLEQEFILHGEPAPQT